MTHVNEISGQRLGWLILIGLLALGVGFAGSLIIARWVRRQTLGMGPRELARLFTYYDAVLASVHEGMVLLDAQGRISSVNAEGRRLSGWVTRRSDGRRSRPGLPEHLGTLMTERAT